MLSSLLQAVDRNMRKNVLMCVESALQPVGSIPLCVIPLRICPGMIKAASSISLQSSGHSGPSMKKEDLSGPST